MPAGLTDTIVDWESKRLSNVKIKSHITANHSLSPKLIWMNNSKIKLRIIGSCLKQDNVTFTSRYVVNLFIFYELDAHLQDVNTVFTLKGFYSKN